MGIDNKTKANSSDIFILEAKINANKDTINENERELSFYRGFFFYNDQNYLTYECKLG